MDGINGASNNQWKMYSSVALITAGNLKGTPEGGRKLQLQTPNGPDRTVAATAGDNLTMGLMLEMGEIAPSGFGWRAGLSIALPWADKNTTTDAEAEQAGAKPGDTADIILRDDVVETKAHLTYTSEINPWLSATVGLGGAMSIVTYCIPYYHAHYVGLGMTEDPNIMSGCTYNGGLTEFRFGISSLAEGAIKWREDSFLTAAVSLTYFPTKGTALAGLLGVQF